MKFKGYVSSRKLNDDSLVQQKVQNLVIREACSKRGFEYKLSATEYGMKKSYLTLNQVVIDLAKNQFDGIAFYSSSQMPKNKRSREKIYQVIIKKKKKLLFSLEDILIKNAKDIIKFENLFKIKFLLKFSPKKIKLDK